jgi:hypothetical protein
MPRPGDGPADTRAPMVAASSLRRKSDAIAGFAAFAASR